MLPGVATAEVYGTAEGCARHAGKQAQGDDAWLLTPDTVSAHESSCKIIRSSVTRPTYMIVVTECAGEGETWEETYGVENFLGPETVTLVRTDSPDFRKELSRCQ